MKSIFTVVALVMSIMASIAHANYNAQQCVNGQCSAPSNNVYSVYSTPQPVSQTVYGQSSVYGQNSYTPSYSQTSQPVYSQSAQPVYSPSVYSQPAYTQTSYPQSVNYGQPVSYGQPVAYNQPVSYGNPVSYNQPVYSQSYAQPNYSQPVYNQSTYATSNAQPVYSSSAYGTTTAFNQPVSASSNCNSCATPTASISSPVFSGQTISGQVISGQVIGGQVVSGNVVSSVPAVSTVSSIPAAPVTTVNQPVYGTQASSLNTGASYATPQTTYASYSPTQTTSQVSGGLAQQKAVQAAQMNLRGHVGGGLGGAKYEGVGWSNVSPQQAIQKCCYWGVRPTAQIGVSRGSDGCWYACVLYN